MSKIDVFFLGREKQSNFQPVNQKCAISLNTVRFLTKEKDSNYKLFLTLLGE